MRILLISSAFNSMTQRFYVELADNGYEVAVELYGGNENLLKESVSLYAPDLIIAPFLTQAIPMEIWGCHVCIIVHPGIEGDRGPSSLDWAIQERWEIWGVTLLQAVAEMDAGPIWASRTFPLRRAPKSSIYRREVTEAAVDCLWEVVEKFSAVGFQPKTLDYTAPGIMGRERPSMKQADRQIDWSHHNNVVDALRRLQARHAERRKQSRPADRTKTRKLADMVEAMQATHYRLCARMRELEMQFEVKASELRSAFLVEMHQIQGDRA